MDARQTAPPPGPARALLAVAPLCPTCRRPVALRAEVLTLSGGGRAVDAAGLRLALRVHLRRCGGC